MNWGYNMEVKVLRVMDFTTFTSTNNQDDFDFTDDDFLFDDEPIDAPVNNNEPGALDIFSAMAELAELHGDNDAVDCISVTGDGDDRCIQFDVKCETDVVGQMENYKGFKVSINKVCAIENRGKYDGLQERLDALMDGNPGLRFRVTETGRGVDNFTATISDDGGNILFESAHPSGIKNCIWFFEDCIRK